MRNEAHPRIVSALVLPDAVLRSPPGRMSGKWFVCSKGFTAKAQKRCSAPQS